MNGIGRGEYDDELTEAREKTRAASALLLIIDGDRGTGFSAQIVPQMLPAAIACLRDVADQMEEAHRTMLEMAITWRCEVCTAMRPDAAISVLKADITPDNLPAGTGTRNIKYCNDHPECLAGAEAIKADEERRR